MKLAGKVALVTGGGTGIGHAIAKGFIDEGAKVCITGRRMPVLENAIQEFKPGAATFCCGDVSKRQDAERMVATALEFGGGLDILVNNAAINTWGPISELSFDTWKDVIDVNLSGPFLLMKTSIPYMIKRKKGSIINISSLGGVRCIPGNPAYCTSKAGLIMLTQQAAVDYGRYNIRCNAVCPGGVETPMSERGMENFALKLGLDIEGVKALLSEDVPLQRVADPSDITGTCVYLASEDSSFTTGAVIMVDGGAAVVDIGRAAIQKALKTYKLGEKPGR